MAWKPNGPTNDKRVPHTEYHQPSNGPGEGVAHSQEFEVERISSLGDLSSSNAPYISSTASGSSNISEAAVVTNNPYPYNPSYVNNPNPNPNPNGRIPETSFLHSTLDTNNANSNWVVVGPNTPSFNHIINPSPNLNGSEFHVLINFATGTNVLHIPCATINANITHPAHIVINASYLYTTGVTINANDHHPTHVTINTNSYEAVIDVGVHPIYANNDSLYPVADSINIEEDNHDTSQTLLFGHDPLHPAVDTNDMEAAHDTPQMETQLLPHEQPTSTDQGTGKATPSLRHKNEMLFMFRNVNNNSIFIEIITGIFGVARNTLYGFPVDIPYVHLNDWDNQTISPAIRQRMVTSEPPGYTRFGKAFSDTAWVLQVVTEDQIAIEDMKDYIRRLSSPNRGRPQGCLYENFSLYWSLNKHTDENVFFCVVTDHKSVNGRPAADVELLNFEGQLQLRWTVSVSGNPEFLTLYKVLETFQSGRAPMLVCMYSDKLQLLIPDKLDYSEQITMMGIPERYRSFMPLGEHSEGGLQSNMTRFKENLGC